MNSSSSANRKLRVPSGRQWGAYRLDLWTALVGPRVAW